MLTIKHIHLSGAEYIYTSETIRYSPAESHTEGAPATIWITAPGPIFEQPLTGGTIFVMNEKGSTVARYDLGASMAPLDADADPAKYPVKGEWAA